MDEADAEADGGEAAGALGAEERARAACSVLGVMGTHPGIKSCRLDRKSRAAGAWGCACGAWGWVANGRAQRV